MLWMNSWAGKGLLLWWRRGWCWPRWDAVQWEGSRHPTTLPPAFISLPQILPLIGTWYRTDQEMQRIHDLKEIIFKLSQPLQIKICSCITCVCESYDTFFAWVELSFCDWGHPLNKNHHDASSYIADYHHSNPWSSLSAWHFWACTSTFASFRNPASGTQPSITLSCMMLTNLWWFIDDDALMALTTNVMMIILWEWWWFCFHSSNSNNTFEWIFRKWGNATKKIKELVVGWWCGWKRTVCSTVHSSTVLRFKVAMFSPTRPLPPCFPFYC